MKKRVRLIGRVDQSQAINSGREYVFEGDFDVEIEDLDEDFVQVVVDTQGSYRWTYRDPGEGLLPGDYVEVPFGYRNHPTVAKVVARGRGNWSGPTKTVKAFLHREEIPA